MLLAVGKNLIVKEVNEKTTTLVQLPKTDNSRPLRVVVVDISNDPSMSDFCGFGGISVGSVIHINQFATARVQHESQEYIVVSRDQVIAVEKETTNA